jgi:hypothetical protein
MYKFRIQNKAGKTISEECDFDSELGAKEYAMKHYKRGFKLYVYVYETGDDCECVSYFPDVFGEWSC